MMVVFHKSLLTTPDLLTLKNVINLLLQCLWASYLNQLRQASLALIKLRVTFINLYILPLNKWLIFNVRHTFHQIQMWISFSFLKYSGSILNSLYCLMNHQLIQFLIQFLFYVHNEALYKNLNILKSWLQRIYLSLFLYLKKMHRTVVQMTFH